MNLMRRWHRKKQQPKTTQIRPQIEPDPGDISMACESRLGDTRHDGTREPSVWRQTAGAGSRVKMRDGLFVDRGQVST